MNLWPSERLADVQPAWAREYRSRAGALVKLREIRVWVYTLTRPCYHLREPSISGSQRSGGHLPPEMAYATTFAGRAPALRLAKSTPCLGRFPANINAHGSPRCGRVMAMLRAVVAAHSARRW